MLRFKPYLASHEFLLEISEDLFPCGANEIEALELCVVPHRGAFAVAGYDQFSLAGEWDWYFVAENLTGSA